MTSAKERWGKVRNVGRYINEGKWDDYWRTGISHAIEKTCLIRGYPLEEIIENITYTETLYLTLRGELPTKEETRLLNAVLCSIPDHQFVASTAPAARFAASAFPDSPYTWHCSRYTDHGFIHSLPPGFCRFYQRVVRTDGG